MVCTSADQFKGIFYEVKSSNVFVFFIYKYPKGLTIDYSYYCIVAQLLSAKFWKLVDHYSMQTLYLNIDLTAIHLKYSVTF